MAIGLGVFGLAASAFWQLTPRELDAMLRGRFGEGAADATPLSSPEFVKLMQRFPDQGAE